MSVFTIADLHLSLGVDKPMDIFGPKWNNHHEKIFDNWQKNVLENDTVIVGGDISWGINYGESLADFKFINKLNGFKIFLRGNHDYWWDTLSKNRRFLTDNGITKVEFLQNNHFELEGVNICGARGWLCDDNLSDEDKKIINREVLRLEMSLKAVKNDKRIYVFLHYPPFYKNNQIYEPYKELFARYNVKKCFYGHLHGPSLGTAFEGNLFGVDYRLVSADYINFNPIKIL